MFLHSLGFHQEKQKSLQSAASTALRQEHCCSSTAVCGGTWEASWNRPWVSRRKGLFISILGERVVRPASSHFARPEWSDWVSRPSVRQMIWSKTQVGPVGHEAEFRTAWVWWEIPGLLEGEAWQQSCLLVPKVYSLCQTHRKTVLCFSVDSVCTLVWN